MRLMPSPRSTSVGGGGMEISSSRAERPGERRIVKYVGAAAAVALPMNSRIGEYSDRPARADGAARVNWPRSPPARREVLVFTESF